jgi:uncharacterized protein YciW
MEMLNYAELLAQRPSSVTEENINKLRNVGFDDVEILEINLIVSYYSFVNRLASGLGVELEE